PKVSNLSPSGNDLKWYDTPTGGSPLNATDALVNGQTYYVSRTNLGCEGPRTAVTVTIDTKPTVTVSNTCVGSSNVTFSQTGGALGGTWIVSGGGNINQSTGEFTPTTAGCFSATYTSGACSDTKSFVIFPATPTAPVVPGNCNQDITVTPPAT